MDVMKYPVLLTTDLQLPIFIRGKVRDTYNLGSHLLIVATDRISAFDVVLPNGIPLKGHVLNRLSSFWFRRLADIVPNHMTEAIDNVHSLDSYVVMVERRYAYPSYLRGRSMVVKKVKRLPVECVVRGYLSGSAWEEYKTKGKIGGKVMPPDLQESQQFPEPIFTPTTKAETGHDVPVTKDYLVKVFGVRIAKDLEEKSLAMYQSAKEYALTRGIIIADTKFEFGIDNGRVILIDEALTPDSSRFWDASKYQAGKPQESYDKQPVRDWLIASGWNKMPPAPVLPPDVIEATALRYIAAYEKLTNRKLAILE
jgi:phosphoribosylaminoimidazole-succinocarboxamide synthase